MRALTSRDIPFAACVISFLFGCQQQANTRALVVPHLAPTRAETNCLLDSTEVANSKNVDIVSITTNSLYGSKYRPENAFDNMPAGGWTQWISADDFRPFTRASVIQVQYASPKSVVGYDLVGRYDVLKDRLPKAWVLQGSNENGASAEDAVNSANWTTLDAPSGMTIGEQWNSTSSVARLSRTLERSKTYSKYRICVTEVNGSSVVDLIEIELLSRMVDDTCLKSRHPSAKP